MDVVYKLVHTHLVVVVPLRLRKRNQLPMELFEIQVCHVPYEVSDKQSTHSYTKVNMEASHLAVKDRNCVELTPNQMATCMQFDETWVCDSIMLQTHQSRTTCASALYWNADPKTVKEVCDFSYLHHIKPPAQIIESVDYLLLANLDMPWSFNCKDKHVPVRHKGSTYAVIPRSAMCSCSLLSGSYFVTQSLCPSDMDNLKLQYPVPN